MTAALLWLATSWAQPAPAPRPEPPRAEAPALPARDADPTPAPPAPDGQGAEPSTGTAPADDGASIERGPVEPGAPEPDAGAAPPTSTLPPAPDETSPIEPEEATAPAPEPLILTLETSSTLSDEPPLPEPAQVEPIGGAALIGLAAMAVGLSLLGGAATRRLAPTGLLPWLARAVRSGARAAAVALTLAAVLAALPEAWRPWLPWAALVLLVVLLLALRDAVRDLAAWVVLLGEGRVRPGWTVSAGGVTGVVDRVGPRVTWIRDEAGGRTALPHHALLAGGVHVDPHHHPEVVTDVIVPWEGDVELVRERLAEAALVSPYRAPGERPNVRRADRAGHWLVAVRVLDLRFARPHRELVRDAAQEALGLEEALKEL